MPYTELTDEQVVQWAKEIPEREEWTKFHELCDEMSKMRSLQDNVKERISEPFRGLVKDELGSQEGGAELDDHIQMLASWLNGADYRMQTWPPSADDEDVERATLQDRFILAAELAMREVNQEAPYWSTSNEHLAHCGVSFIRSHPRSGYYTEMPAEGDFPERALFQAARSEYIDAMMLTEIWVKEAVHPRSFSAIWDTGSNHAFSLTVETTHRSLGQLGKDIGLEEAAVVLDFWDFGPARKPVGESAIDAFSDQSVELAEVWAGDEGWLVVVGGNQGKKRSRPGSSGAILDRWTNQLGFPPYSIRMFKPRPWRSPLDKMLYYTPERNETAEMLKLQRRQALFRFPQEVQARPDLGDDLTFSEDDEPETVEMDPENPLPSPPPGSEWRPTPFEFQPTILEEYREAVAKHENSGLIIRTLFGAKTGEFTAVGTADLADEQARRAFTFLIRSIGSSIAEDWRVMLRWWKANHPDDELKVWDMEPPAAGSGKPMRRITRTLKGSEVISEHIQARLIPSSLLSQVALMETADKMIQRGYMAPERAIENGWLPGIEDANFNEQEVFAANLRKGMANNVLEVTLAAHRQMLEGQALQPGQGMIPGATATGAPMLPAGERGDRRNPGPSPLNVSDSGIGAGASDTIGRQARASGQGA